ncbi:ATP-binding protein [Ohtaekwangia sp.]|uniref:ATP-binding protein n=1 Tax=Ohtaekwangia sp. TaxID=2066019 RepID=UPI002F937309
MRSKLKKRQATIILLIVATVVLNLAGEQITSREFSDFNNHNLILLRDLHYRDKINDLRNDILLIESRVRGLVVTDKEEFISNVEAEFDRAYADLNLVLEETGKQNELVDLADSLNHMIRHKIQFNRQIIDVYYQRGKEQAEDLIATAYGKKLRENIFTVTAELDSFKHNEIIQLEKEVEQKGKRAALLSGILPLFSATIFCILGYLLMQNMRRQDMLYEQSESVHDKERSAYMVREQFISNISHEIRTPLNSVIGYSGLLQKTTLNESQQKFVHAIQTSGESLLHIINELLDLGKMQEGLLVIKKSNFILSELVDQVALMFQEAFKVKNIQFQVYIDPAIPAELVGDAVKLRQILVNLINNALKFTEAGTVDVEVKQKVSNDSQLKLQIYIRDTGIGIAKEHLPHIFERFYQVDANADRRYSGTGLGLAIIYQLVELMGGKIHVTSELGKGTAFTIELPFEMAEKPWHEIKSLHIKAPDSRKKKVLVIDDNALNRDLTMHILTSWNFDVSVVESGDRAIELLHRESFDLILMDVQMPGMDGYQTTATIRNTLKSDVPIIALTAHSNKTERAKCLNAGMNEYVSKPFDELELFSMITRLLSIQADTLKYINLDYLRNLSKGNKEFERRILRRFVEETPAHLDKLETAIRTQDTLEIRKIIHDLKANVSIVGLSNRVDGEFEKINNLNEDYKREEAFRSFHIVKDTLIHSISEINLIR